MGATTATSPSRNGSVTGGCGACGAPLPPGRSDRRYCSDNCRQAGHRRRHASPAEPPSLPPRRPRRPVTVYECDGCGARTLGEQYCDECRTFMRRVGVGGCCPACSEPIAYQELTRD